MAYRARHARSKHTNSLVMPLVMSWAMSAVMKHYNKGVLAVHLEDGSVTLRHVAAPHRPQGLATLRLLLAGICNTDLELQRGYYGFAGTPGHEFVAEVVEADSAELIGKRVVG